MNSWVQNTANGPYFHLIFDNRSVTILLYWCASQSIHDPVKDENLYIHHKVQKHT
jgi:hypothetical protein